MPAVASDVSSLPEPPAAEYARRRALRVATLAACQRLNLLLSRVRLAIFIAAVALLVLAWRGTLSPLWLLAPVVAFVVAAVKHDHVIRREQTADRAIAFYDRGLARIDGEWAGQGEPGERFADDQHLYARDLDLFGDGSLFQLLSVARTRAGERILADWLKAPATRDEILARHVAVTELTPALDLREDVALAGSDVRAAVDPDALVAWAEAPPTLSPPVFRVGAVLSTAAVIGLGVYWWRGGPGGLWLVALAAQGLLSAFQRKRVEHVLHTAEGPARELGVLLHVLTRLERERFAAPRLAAVQQQISSATGKASDVVGRLRTLVDIHDWQHNIVFAPIGALLMWETHLAWAIQHWRLAHGRKVRAWLEAAGQFEAFSSLAAYRYEHPSDPFPEIVDGDSGPAYAGTRLGHPLVPAAKMVHNDLDLSGQTRLLVVSGSNMSGKSTMLRTVGINAVLALAGAPVRASALRLTPMVIGATLRIQDSLQEGRSRFYAEITRIREISDVARRGDNLLFLLDELFHGTNSHDRLTGASGVLRGLLAHRTIGLITTHDLALTAVADALAPQAANVHFEDQFDGSDITFDYTMKPGPVTRSNAVALMRAVGLDVDPE
jgi:hypothetical protein